MKNLPRSKESYAWNPRCYSWLLKDQSSSEYNVNLRNITLYKYVISNKIKETSLSQTKNLFALIDGCLLNAPEICQLFLQYVVQT